MSAFNLALPGSAQTSQNASAGPSRAPSMSRAPSPTPSAASEADNDDGEAEPTMALSQHEQSRAHYASKKEGVMWVLGLMARIDQEVSISGDGQCTERPISGISNRDYQ